MKKISLKRLVSAMVVAVMLVTSLIPVNAAFDGYIEDNTS